MSETRKMTLPVLMFARENEEFRKVLWTVDNTQLVLMAMPEEDEIGGEVHEGHDQSLYFVAGSGEAKIGDVETKIADGDVGVVSYACRRSLHAALYPFRPHAKTMADHTLKRSITTKPVTIQPPPARAMNGVARAGSFFAKEPRSA